MKNDHTVNRVRGIPDFAYIPFDRAYKLVEPLTKIGGNATSKEFYELIGRNKTGWLGLEIKSARAWGLIEDKKMILSKKFYELSSSSDPNYKLEIKKNSFLNIHLFKEIFEKYSDIGLPKKEELIRFLESKYKINPTYSPSVAKTLFDSVQKYFREYGKKYPSQNNEIIPKKEIETSLNDFAKKKDSISIKVISPIGNFSLEASNKKEFDKIVKIIEPLWDKGSDTDENQEEGAHESD